jgi:hypothetical protein
MMCSAESFTPARRVDPGVFGGVVRVASLAPEGQVGRQQAIDSGRRSDRAGSHSAGDRGDPALPDAPGLGELHSAVAPSGPPSE